MNLITRLFKGSEPTPEAKPKEKLSQRSFLAALRDRFTDDWNEIQSLNVSIKDGLETLRGRSRDLAVNNEYARRYFKLLKTNVIGPDGIQISVQARNLDGSLDPISDRIETEFWKWAHDPRNCSVTGKLSLVKIEELLIETIARDGEALVLPRRGPEFGPYNFQVQLLDIDHLDVNFNSTATNGNRIVQSVELDNFDRPVAYWIWQRNPSETTLAAPQHNQRIRVPASDLWHIFDPERASQVRGFPWIAPAALALQHIAKFRESTLIAARVSANRQVFFSQGEGETFDDDNLDDEGNLSFESKPGTQEVLPRGWDVKTVDWAAPTEKLGDFQKHVLRGAAAGLGVSYNALANDLESVNYSSARFGALEEHALYRSTQTFFINAFVRPVYEEWLQIQLLTNTWGLNIPPSRFEKFRVNVQYRPRSWSSVDPVKDTNADRLMIEAGLTSWSDVISKSGKDPEEVFNQIAKDKEKMAELGITPAFANTAVTAQGFSEQEANAMNQKPVEE